MSTRQRWIAGFIAASGLLSFVPAAHAVPMWSRRYSVGCEYCHAYPSLQLTDAGQDFLRRGHRTESDSFDKNAINLLSAHGQWDYAVQQHQSTAFPEPELHVHFGGALDSHFSSYVDAMINGDFEVAYMQFTANEGKEAYFTMRAGKLGPTIIRNYGNGIGASTSTPLILTDATLDANPFNPARDSFGIDIGERYKALFLQGGVLNGEDVEGQATVGNRKDVYATAELNTSGQPTGVGLYYHHGGYGLGDPAAGPLASDRYDREGVFANVTRDRFRVAGAYLYGKDRVEGLADRKIQGYYVQGDVHPVAWMTPFARYDWVKTEDENGSDVVEQVTGGASLRLFQSEITSGRAVVEVSRRSEGDDHVNGALVSLLWMF